jgi:hypothetical protein
MLDSNRALTPDLKRKLPVCKDDSEAAGAINAALGTGDRKMRYAIRSTPGGLLKDEGSGRVIYFDSYAEAEAEALRLTREAYGNPRVAGFDFTPVPVPTENE